MQLGLILGLFFVVSIGADKDVASSDAKPYEEDDAHFSEQNMSQVMGITERAFVVKRNFNTTTPHRCHSVKVDKKINESMYMVSLGAAPSLNQTRSFILVINSTVNLLKTGDHTEYNAANFTFWHGAVSQVRKLMHLNENKTCFIMVENRNSSSEPAACQMLMPESTIDGYKSTDCDEIYNATCPDCISCNELYPRCCRERLVCSA